MRAHVPGLASPRPIGRTLPSVYERDEVTQRFCAALDEVIAPVFATLDSLTAYLDPATTPADMLDWLAAWIGIVFHGHESEPRKRQVIRAGAGLLPWNGTVRCVREAVRAVYGVEQEVIDSGGAVCSTEPGTPPPGEDRLGLVVRLTVPDPAAFDPRRLDELVATLKPAHVPHRVEIVPRS
jgi:phage tail-like protein